MSTRPIRLALSVTAGLICLSVTGLAQVDVDSMKFDTAKIYAVKVADGATYIGKFIERTADAIVINTASVRRVEIPIRAIVSVREVSDANFRNGRYWFENPNPTRYLIGPSAYNVKKGDGYYQNIYLVVNGFNVGITDNFSIGGGLELISTFSSLADGGFDPIFFFTPKVAFEVSDKVHLGGGVLLVNAPGFDDGARGSIGITYGIGTFGTTDNNVTAGIGWGFVNRDFNADPVVTVSGMVRISRNASLVSENWFVPTDGYDVVYSYGVRFFGESLAVDLAFFNNRDIADIIVIGIPYVDFVVTF